MEELEGRERPGSLGICKSELYAMVLVSVTILKKSINGCQINGYGMRSYGMRKLINITSNWLGGTWGGFPRGYGDFLLETAEQAVTIARICAHW